MDYREHLLRPMTLRFVDYLVEEVLLHPGDFAIVYRLIFDEDEKVAWRAAWACQKISEIHPEWFTETHFNELIKLVLNTTNGGLHRGCLSVLNNIAIPQPISVELLNVCFEWMISPRFPIAVQALSMKMIYRFCMIEPGIIPEFLTYLEAITPDDYSKGFNAARNNILKKLIAK